MGGRVSIAATCAATTRTSEVPSLPGRDISVSDPGCLLSPGAPSSSKSVNSSLSFSWQRKLTDLWPRRYTVTLISRGATSINDRLVAAGLAWHHPGQRGAGRYEQLEQRARVARKGLWRDRQATAQACLSQCQLASSRRVAAIGRGARRARRGRLRREGCALVSCKQRCRGSGWFLFRCGGPSEPPQHPGLRRRRR